MDKYRVYLENIRHRTVEIEASSQEEAEWMAEIEAELDGKWTDNQVDVQNVVKLS